MAEPTQHAELVRHYRCPTCGATKEIRDPLRRKNTHFPDTVFCGWRGCTDFARALIDGEAS